MDARTGKKIRLGRIFRGDGRSLSIAYSHGVLRGPLPGIDRADDLAAGLRRFRGADAVMVSPGLLPLLEDEFVADGAPALIIQAEWMNPGRMFRGARKYDEGYSAAMVSAEDALAAGADAVMSYLWIGGSDPEQEAEEVRRNSVLARACERVGLPLMIESRALRDEVQTDGTIDLELLRLHTRIAAELGADFIKTIYSGSVQSFREVVSGTPVPILVAGGSKRTDADALRIAEEVMAAGAAGLVFGRNIFQAANAADMLERLGAIVHPAATAT